jgi:hypothetical protein
MADKITPYYFPTKDPDVGPWAHNFMMVLYVNAARWGIAEALVTAFWDAFAKRKQPDAGKVSVEQKKLALKALKKGGQNMVNGHINHNETVTPDDRVALGLYVYKPGRGPVPAPTTTVVLWVVLGLVGQVVVYVTDSATPNKRGKPYGALFMELACGIFESPPAGVGDLPRVITATKSPVVLTFREEDRGKTVYIAGRWKGRGQKEGPWSAIISVIIP